ncbi:hypothetical protein [Flavobacterium urocaniciphilum]|uniref:Uncharacterized protein n=1 Tax=Flavobacterium urocaniciphilum TaxID=1299341 RepID=A0A1H9DAY4_9FLAO|nr:hypothetical protein [Flavobacterium urocaniciphilum]SEQ10650.1 hypothetical protein SAMN05444005_106140 [Flavobacterium urocaniciphilum]
MIRILLSCIAILSTIFYCVWEQNKANTIMKENCIEIYLYEEQIPFNNCIKVTKMKDFNFKDYPTIDTSKAYFDTIKNIFTYASDFPLSKNKIKKNPIIKNNHIQKYDLINNNLQLNYIEDLKIRNHSEIYNLTQFVICVNKEPTFNGYFYTGFGARRCYSNFIYYFPYISFLKQQKNKSLFPNKIVHKSKLEFLLNKETGSEFNKIDIKKDYPELYQAFKNSNRLIE